MPFNYATSDFQPFNFFLYSSCSTSSGLMLEALNGRRLQLLSDHPTYEKRSEKET